MRESGLTFWRPNAIPVRPVHMQAARYALLQFCAKGRIAFDDLPWDVIEAVEAAIAPSRNDPKQLAWLRNRPKANKKPA